MKVGVAFQNFTRAHTHTNTCTDIIILHNFISAKLNATYIIIITDCFLSINTQDQRLHDTMSFLQVYMLQSELL